jgi:hypothetical protein
MCRKQTFKGAAQALLIAGAIGTAGCALQVAMAAGEAVLEHDRVLPSIELRLESLEAALDEHAKADADVTAKIRADVAATREGVARIEGRLDR